MEFIKKHSKKILIIAIILVAIWYFFLRKKTPDVQIIDPATLTAEQLTEARKQKQELPIVISKLEAALSNPKATEQQKAEIQKVLPQLKTALAQLSKI